MCDVTERPYYSMLLSFVRARDQVRSQHRRLAPLLPPPPPSRSKSQHTEPAGLGSQRLTPNFKWLKSSAMSKASGDWCATRSCARQVGGMPDCTCIHTVCLVLGQGDQRARGVLGGLA